MQFLIYPAAVALVLGVLVFVHELGHYLVAKLFRVRVEVFSLGFGKRLVGFRRGDTDYRVSLLPIGGYVKMAGENPMEDRTGDPGEFMSHPRWQRFLIAIAGPVMNVLLAIGILTGLYMVHHDYPASERIPVDVLWMNQGSSAEKAGLQKGDRIIQVQDIKNPTWEQFLQTELISPDQDLNVTVRRGDQVLHKTLLAKATGVDNVGDVGLDPPEAVGYIEPGKPADRAGIEPGDILVSINGKPVKNLDDMRDEIQKIKSTPATLIVLRDGKEVSITVTPALLPSGTSKPEYRIGVSSEYIEKLPFTKALSEAYTECKDNSLLIFKLVGRMVHNHKMLRQVSGPIGIMQISGEAAMIGWPPLLKIMALISLNLAVFNLFPIPILDGGLMLMLLIEAVMRRDIKQEIKERVYQVAFVFLILFAVVVIYNDLAKSFHM
ncbi:MAG: RIP metalloprotease RseP [Actinomycetota bacterium]